MAGASRLIPMIATGSETARCGSVGSGRCALAVGCAAMAFRRPARSSRKTDAGMRRSRSCASLGGRPPARILDTAPGMFLSMLRYKAEEAGAELVEVPTRSLKPTQRCARCWETTKKSLSQRIHHCAHCGFTLDRDWNAALVALIYAMTGNGREPAACVRLPSSGARWHETPCRAA